MRKLKGIPLVGGEDPEWLKNRAQKGIKIAESVGGRVICGPQEMYLRVCPTAVANSRSMSRFTAAFSSCWVTFRR
jgi:hypothetical protein